MVDRILHISHTFSKEYNTELLQRAAEVALSKGPNAVAPHLVAVEKLNTDEAAVLSQKINGELRKINRQVLLQYLVPVIFFGMIVVLGVMTRSYILAGVFLVPVLLVLYSLQKFVRRNSL